MKKVLSPVEGTVSRVMDLLTDMRDNQYTARHFMATLRNGDDCLIISSRSGQFATVTLYDSVHGHSQDTSGVQCYLKWPVKAGNGVTYPTGLDHLIMCTGAHYFRDPNTVVDALYVETEEGGK